MLYMLKFTTGHLSTQHDSSWRLHLSGSMQQNLRCKVNYSTDSTVYPTHICRKKQISHLTGNYWIQKVCCCLVFSFSLKFKTIKESLVPSKRHLQSCIFCVAAGCTRLDLISCHFKKWVCLFLNLYLYMVGCECLLLIQRLQMSWINCTESAFHKRKINISSATFVCLLTL